MQSDGSELAAILADLSSEPRARDYADLIEFRMDVAQSPINQIEQYEGELPLIAANRAAEDSESSSSERLDVLSEVAKYNAVELIDIDLQTAKEYTEEIEDLRDSGVEVIVTYTDTSGTPPTDTLIEIFEECGTFGDFAKVMTFAESRKDALNLLEATHASDDKGLDVIAVSHGEPGRHTRVAAAHYGSQIVYAPLDLDSDLASIGDIPLENLSSLLHDIEHGTDHVELMGELKDKFST